MRFFICLIACFLSLTLLAQFDPESLPDLGDASGAVLPLRHEKEIGENAIEGMQKKRLLIDDIWVNNYVQNLGDRLVKAIPSPRFSYRFFVINDPNINAFSIPGGYIVLHSGLIKAFAHEYELASVLAHEIAHIEQKHLNRQLEQAANLRDRALMSVLAGIIVSLGAPDIGGSAIAAGLGSAQLEHFQYSRNHESEADRRAADILRKAGFSPQALPLTFTKMERLQQSDGFREIAYLLTHPLNRDRITDSRNIARDKEAPSLANDMSFVLMATRLEALETPDPGIQLKRLTEEATHKPLSFPLRIKQALLALQTDKKAALPLTASLHADYPKLVDVTQLYIAALVKNNQSELALETLEALRKHAAYTRPLTLTFAEIQLHLKNYAACEQTLLQWLNKQPNDLKAQSILIESYKHSNQPYAFHMTMSDYLLVQRYYGGALNHILLAQKVEGLSPSQKQEARRKEGVLLEKKRRNPWAFD